MKKRENTFEKYQFKLRLVFDFFSTLIAWFSAYYIRFFVLPGGMHDSLLLFSVLSVLAVFSTFFFLFYHDLYEPSVLARWRTELGSIVRVSIDVFMVFVVFYYYQFEIKVSRIALLLFLGTLFIFLSIGRRICNIIIGKKVKSGQFIQRTLIVGYGKKVTDYYSSTVESGDGSRIKFVGQYMGAEKVGDLPQIKAASLADAIRENNVDIAVIGFPPEDSRNRL
ncbi:MAG: hypothetical protein J5768_06845, partial [Spirochaetales bacterium]|nr:hypothetical protein [Spirochaetales bacterium]